MSAADLGFGRAVRRLRREREISRVELAAWSDVSLVQLGRIERGEVSPTTRVYEAIVAGLGFASGEDLLAAARRVRRRS